MNTNENTLNVDTAPATDQASNPDHASQAPTGGADAVEATAGTATATAEKLTSDAPTGDTGTADSGTPDQASNPDQGAPAGAVLQVEPKPIKARGETNKAYNKRVAAWRAGQPQGATPDKPAKPEAAKGDQGKGETKPPATPVISAAKPAKQTPREAALADNTLTAGYDLSHWPSWCPIKPSREAIMASRALGRHEALTKSELAIATAIEQGNPLHAGRQCNVPDLGTAFNTVPQVNKGGHAKPDPKMVVINMAAYDGDLSLVKGACMGLNPASTLSGARAKAVYGATLTAKALKKVEAYFSANGLKVPRWLSDPHGVADEMAIAAEKAAKAAAREAKKSNVPA